MGNLEEEKRSMADVLSLLEEELEHSMIGVRRQVQQAQQKWWKLTCRVDDLASSARMAEEHAFRAEAAMAEVAKDNEKLKRQVSSLLSAKMQAPPPKWLRREARKARRVGILPADAVKLAKKCLRWAETHMVKSGELEGENDGDVQEDAGL